MVLREESEPAFGNFLIGPGGEDIGASAQDGVVVVIHDGISANIDSENGGEEFQSIDQPFFAVGEVLL